MNIADPDKKDTFPAVEEVEKKKKFQFDPALVTGVIENLRVAMMGTEEDLDQETLVKVVQTSRSFLLQYAMQAYLDNPKNAGLLEGVTQIIAQIEKTVRDDRKERAKKKDSEGNRVSFNQMLEALQGIQKGSINLPVFEFTQFILDPSMPLIADADLTSSINPAELVMGVMLADIDGNPMELIPLDD